MAVFRVFSGYASLLFTQRRARQQPRCLCARAGAALEPLVERHTRSSNEQWPRAPHLAFMKAFAAMAAMKRPSTLWIFHMLGSASSFEVMAE